MNTNNPLNVMSNQKRSEINQVDEIADMINKSAVNRAQRRRIEKSIARTTKLSQKTMEKLQNSAYEKYKEVTDKDFVHFNAILALVMYEDYHWKEDENQDHGQITSLMERIQKKMRKYQDLEYSTEDLAREVYKKTGILLISDTANPEDYMDDEEEE
ncbi:MAG: hypothetical protein IKR19_08315 [Acholeplasmatales bacterium]|nr:hypothetical protein [Acholeplasmatales bacterium]